MTSSRGDGGEDMQGGQGIVVEKTTQKQKVFGIKSSSKKKNRRGEGEKGEEKKKSQKICIKGGEDSNDTGYGLTAARQTEVCFRWIRIVLIKGHYRKWCQARKRRGGEKKS